MGSRQTYLAVREDLCPAGAIRRAESQFIARNKVKVQADDGWSDGEDGDQGDWEAFDITELYRQQAAYVRKSRASRAKASTRANSMRQSVQELKSPLKKKARPDRFDHEATFAEDLAEVCTGVGSKGTESHKDKGAIRKSFAPSNIVGSTTSSGTFKCDIKKWVSRGFSNGRNPLVELVRLDKQISEMEEILADYPECINEEDMNSQSALFYACGTGHMDVFELLVDCSAEVGCSNKSGYTPLMRALRHNHLELCRELIRLAADPYASDRFGSCAMHVVAAAGHEAGMELLLSLSEGESLLNHRDDDGGTPLQASVRKGNLQVTEALLHGKSNPNLTDAGGRSPLLWALASSDLDIVHVLVGNGAHVNTEDKDGKSLLLWLAGNIIKHKSRPDVCDQTIVGIVAALEAKADPNTPDPNGLTPLMLAAKHDEPMLCTLFAAHGADLMAVDCNDRSALSIADKRGRVDVVRVLKEFGAARVVAGERYNRMLLRVAFYGCGDACETVLERGADPSAKTMSGKSDATKIALSNGHTTTYKHLLKALEDATSHKGDKKKDIDGLKAWIDDVRVATAQWGMILHGTRFADADLVVRTLEQVILAGHNQREAVLTSELMLADYLRKRRQQITKKAVTNLRKIKSMMRRNKLLALAASIEAWDKAGNADPTELQTLITMGSGGIKLIRLSEAENADAYSRRCDEAQVLALQAPLEVAVQLPNAFQEVIAARRLMIESTEAVDPLVCRKCTRSFGCCRKRERHEADCRSSIGRAEEEKTNHRRRIKVESAIHHLVEAAHQLLCGTSRCQDLLDEIKSSRDTALKPSTNLPEILYCYQGVFVLDQALQRVYTHRASVVQRETSELAAKWSLKDPFLDTETKTATALKYCQLCFVKEITRACDHFLADVQPHKCLCSACAFDMANAMRTGEEALCPLCQRPVKQLLVARLSPETIFHG